MLFSRRRNFLLFLRKMKIMLDKLPPCPYNNSCKPRWTVSSAGMSTCLTCMGSQVRVLYCPPSSRTKKDIYAKNPEVSTASGFFCAHFLKLEKKISKRVLAKSVDLNLYPRDFGPLFREFFGEAALFYSRQNVEFEQVFLLVLLDGHSECMCHCVDTGKAQNTLGGFKMTIENARALQEQLANEAIAQLNIPGSESSQSGR